MHLPSALRRFSVFSACFLVAMAVGFERCSADSREEISPLLAKPVIDKETSQREVLRFIESRIIPFPEVTSTEEWEKQAESLRQETLERVVFRGEAARWRDYRGKVVWKETIEGGPEYTIRKLTYEALPGMWIPALLYEPKEITGKIPVVMNVNGHDPQGKSVEYKQIRCINQAKRGMIALNVEWLGMGQLKTDGFNHGRMNQLDLCGTSGLAPFYLTMVRGLDLLLSHKNADASRVAVAGLSGGGWQTILISSLDKRVTLADPVAGYSGFGTRLVHFADLGDSEQAPADLGMTADYLHLTAMRAPRPTLLTYNSKDNCCFQADYALPPLLDIAQPIYKLYGKSDALRWHINEDPGTHNFDIDNRQQFYQMLGDFFYADQADFTAKEISCDSELKTDEELLVDVPEKNEDFHSLASGLMESLPAASIIPSDQSGLEQWQMNSRRQLKSIVRARPGNVQATLSEEVTSGTILAEYWKLSVDGDWSVPAVILQQEGESAKATAIVVADGGRASIVEEIDQLLKTGKRVVAIDPCYLGESQITGRSYLFPLFLSTVGERTVGIQASQVAGISRWLKTELPEQNIELHAYGPKSGLLSLIAAALEINAINELKMSDSLPTLKQIIEKNLTANTDPEYFCFGLLQQFDVMQLSAMIAPRKIIVDEPTDRHRQELESLRTIYKTFGMEFNPLKAQ